MTITAPMVKELRMRTGAGMMECKRALTETSGDLEAAVEVLRKSGAAKADKKAARIAAEGAISAWVSEDRKQGVLVEVNCETDFVAKDENFVAFLQAVTETIAAERPADVVALGALLIKGGDCSVEEARKALISKVGEKVEIRRFTLLEASADGRISYYLHGNRIGVLVHTVGDRDDLGRDIAMHVAASKPMCVAKEQVPDAHLHREREIYRAQAEQSGKPAQIVEKIVEGRIQKYLNEVTLLGQPFVKDPDQTIDKLLRTAGAEVRAFLRYEVGEGLERKDDDFVAEVMAQAKGA